MFSCINKVAAYKTALALTDMMKTGDVSSFSNIEVQSDNEFESLSYTADDGKIYQVNVIVGINAIE